MHSILICFRAKLEAQRITAFATRRGIADSVRIALSAHEALSTLSEDPAELVLVDTTASNLDYAFFTRQVRSTAPGASVVLFGLGDPRLTAAALAAGARGVVRCGMRGDEVISALACALLMNRSGGDAALPRQPDPAGVRTPRLTGREMQVLRAMTEGRSNIEIGKMLYLSQDTVKTHARRLYRKLGARDRAHAVATGFRSGLVS